MRGLTLPKIISIILIGCLTFLGVSLASPAVASSMARCSPDMGLPGYNPQDNGGKPESYSYKPVDDDVRRTEAEPSDTALEKLADELGNAKLTTGTLNHMLMRWRAYKDKNIGNADAYDFERWRTSYITILQNRRIGDAFEEFLWEKFGLGEGANSGQWRKNAQLPTSVLEKSPQFDITNTYKGTRGNKTTPKMPQRIPPVGQRIIMEAKSGSTLSDHAKKQFLKNLDYMSESGAQLIMLFGSAPDQSVIDWMNDALQAWVKDGANTGKTAPNICYHNVNSIPVAQSTGTAGVPTTEQSQDNPAQTEQYNTMSEELNAEVTAEQQAQAETDGTADDRTPAETPVPTTEPDLTPVTTQAPKPTTQPNATPTGGSPTGGTPAGAPAEAPAAAPAEAPVTAPYYGNPIGAPATVSVPAGAPGTLGGIDFTSLQLRYVTASVDGKTGTQYAFRTGTLADDAPSYGGRRNATMAMDALNVWLALTPDKFWVNLKPTEPDRIIDAEFGRTQAGRILLEADLAMKEISGSLQKSDTELGRNFMNALGGDKCFLGRRQWIEPLPASIHVDGDQLYILDAPLTVKLGHDDSDISPGQSCPGQDPAVTTGNGELYDQMIMPAVINAVNNDPEFADLRRVYASRVAAEWYRTRNKTSQYSAQINSGNIDRWVMTWKPREVFDRYVTSFNNPKPVYSWTTQQGNTTWTFSRSWGGVDFSKVQMTDVGAEKFAQDYPQMAHDAAASLSTIAVSNNQVWLGSATITGDPQQLWPMFRTPWTAFLAPTPAPTRAIFYLAVITPVAVWGAVGVGSVWRRRRSGKGI